MCAPEAVLDCAAFDEACVLLHKVDVPDRVKRALIELLSRFVNQFKLDTTNSLVSDRSFLVKAIKVFRAQALLDGRMQVIPTDLAVWAMSPLSASPRNSTATCRRCLPK